MKTIKTLRPKIRIALFGAFFAHMLLWVDAFNGMVGS